MRLDNRIARVLVDPAIHQVEIFFQRRMQSDHALRLLARLEEPAFRIHRSKRLPVFAHIHNGPLAAVVRVIVLCVRAHRQRVWPDRHALTRRQFALDILIESRARKTNHDYDHAEVNDVPAVTSCIAARELHHRREQILPRVASDHPPAADELGNHRRRHHHRQDDRDQRVERRLLSPRLYVSDRH